MQSKKFLGLFIMKTIVSTLFCFLLSHYEFIKLASNFFIGIFVTNTYIFFLSFRKLLD